MSPETSATPSAKEGNHILGWVFGIIFLLMSLAYVFSSVIAGFAMLLLGLLLLPPSRKWFEKKINKKISRLAAFGIGTVLFIVAMVAYPTHSASTKDTNTATNQVANTNVANTNTAVTTNTNQAEVTPVVVEPVKEEPKPEPTTLDKLWTALDDSIKTRDGYDVKWDDEYKTAYLIRSQDTFWSEDALVEDTYRALNYETLITT